ncbi:MAG: protein kinase [Polyangiaceae bacterium]
MDANARRFPPGLELTDKYVVERVLGAGGMGVVLAVKHRELGTQFAMKLMLAELGGHAGARERFAREAKAAAQLKSVHVARVFDFGFLPDDSPYMVLELLEGQNLAERLARGGPLSAQQIARFMLDACDALAEAHDHGVVHRDLKPSNMFVTKHRVKLLDFGIAKTVGDDSGLTKTATGMGSPHYMSPEQMRSAKSVDKRSDIWSLGATMFELCTGRVPFPGQSATEVAFAVMENPVPDVLELAPDTPVAFARIVSRCLSKLPQDRYPDIPTLARDLVTVAGDDTPLEDPEHAAAPGADEVATAPTVLAPSEKTELATELQASRTIAGEPIAAPIEPLLARPQRPSKPRRAALYVGIAATLAVLAIGATRLGSHGGATSSSTRRADTTTTTTSTASADAPAGSRAAESLGKRVLSRRGLHSLANVTIWLSKNLPKGEEFETYVRGLLEGYRAVADNVHFSIKEPTGKTVDELKEKGFSVRAFTPDGTATQKIGVSGICGVEIEYGLSKSVIGELLPGDTSTLDFRLAWELVAMADLEDQTPRSFGVLTRSAVPLTAPLLVPKDSSSPTDLVGNIQGDSPHYKFVDIDLKGGESAVPADLVGLIVTQPATDYTDKELRRIDEFALRGNKTLIFYASAVNLEPYVPTMLGRLDTHNLDKLLSGYGVELVPAVALDSTSGFVGHGPFIQFPSLLLLNRKKDTNCIPPVLGLTHDMTTLAMPFASPLRLHEDRQPGAEFTVLARTTKGAFLSQAPTLDFSAGREVLREQESGEETLAVMVRRIRRSAFAGVSDDTDLPIPPPLAEAGSRLLVFSSSEFPYNPFLYSGARSSQAKPEDKSGAPADLQLSTWGKAYASDAGDTVLMFKRTLEWAVFRQLEMGD